MEKPDANGFVNINWPSKSIPHGGIFHTRVEEPSADRQQFLKVLLEESKLTIAQRQKEKYQLRQNDKKEPVPYRAQVQMVRPRTSKRRSLSAIRESGILDLDPYQPLKRGEDREKLKERLVNSMAYGDSPEQVPPPCPRPTKPKSELPTNKQQWNELVTQIRERAEWLAEMEYLGEAAPHRDIINDQIAERMRALDALGIDSECSTARSSVSGHSTLRSREKLPNTVRSNGSTAKSQKSDKSVRSKTSAIKSQKNIAEKRNKKEENVAAYNHISSLLQYSPRRRV